MWNGSNVYQYCIVLLLLWESEGVNQPALNSLSLRFKTLSFRGSSDCKVIPPMDTCSPDCFEICQFTEQRTSLPHAPWSSLIPLIVKQYVVEAKNAKWCCPKKSRAVGTKLLWLLSPRSDAVIRSLGTRAHVTGCHLGRWSSGMTSRKQN